MVKWYVTRVHNRAQEKTMRQLAQLGIEHFVPMCHNVVAERGRKVKRLVPAIKDFIFVHSSKDAIADLMQNKGMPLLFYYSHCSHVQNDALWVRDAEMQMFMRAAEAYDRDPSIQPFGQISLRDGQLVRVINGELAGMQGRYVQLRRGQRKQLLLALDNLITVSLKLAPDDLIEIVE